MLSLMAIDAVHSWRLMAVTHGDWCRHSRRLMLTLKTVDADAVTHGLSRDGYTGFWTITSIDAVNHGDRCCHLIAIDAVDSRP
jgi:hypothetical protein